VLWRTVDLPTLEIGVLLDVQELKAWLTDFKGRVNISRIWTSKTQGIKSNGFIEKNPEGSSSL